MKIKARSPRTYPICLAGELNTVATVINGYEVFKLLDGSGSMRRLGDVWPCGTFRNFETAARIAEITFSGKTIMKVKKKKKAGGIKYPLPREIAFHYGPGQPISNVEFVPDCRQQFFVFKDSWSGCWHICHHPTQSLLIYAAPSKDYALKVFENVLPLLDLMKVARVLWYGDRRPVAALVDDYLANVWKVEYPISEIPTVKQWQKSGCGNSYQNVNESLSTKKSGGLKIRRRR